MIVPCNISGCDFEATHYWWIKVESGHAERLMCYVHARDNFQQDLATFGDAVVPGTEVDQCPS